MKWILGIEGSSSRWWLEKSNYSVKMKFYLSPFKLHSPKKNWVDLGFGSNWKPKLLTSCDHLIVFMKTGLFVSFQEIYVNVGLDKCRSLFEQISSPIWWISPVLRELKMDRSDTGFTHLHKESFLSPKFLCAWLLSNLVEKKVKFCKSAVVFTLPAAAGYTTCKTWHATVFGISQQTWWMPWVKKERKEIKYQQIVRWDGDSVKFIRLLDICWCCDTLKDKKSKENEKKNGSCTCHDHKASVGS